MNPPQVNLRWCPTCGRTDLRSNLNLLPKRHYSQGELCPGEPVIVEYEPKEPNA